MTEHYAIKLLAERDALRAEVERLKARLDEAEWAASNGENRKLRAEVEDNTKEMARIRKKGLDLAVEVERLTKERFLERVLVGGWKHSAEVREQERDRAWRELTLVDLECGLETRSVREPVQHLIVRARLARAEALATAVERLTAERDDAHRELGVASLETEKAEAERDEARAAAVLGDLGVPCPKLTEWPPADSIECAECSKAGGEPVYNAIVTATRGEPLAEYSCAHNHTTRVIAWTRRSPSRRKGEDWEFEELPY